jgi:hypothetical protein
MPGQDPFINDADVRSRFEKGTQLKLGKSLATVAALSAVIFVGPGAAHAADSPKPPHQGGGNSNPIQTNQVVNLEFVPAHDSLVLIATCGDGQTAISGGYDIETPDVHVVAFHKVGQNAWQARFVNNTDTDLLVDVVVDCHG